MTIPESEGTLFQRDSNNMSNVLFHPKYGEDRTRLMTETASIMLPEEPSWDVLTFPFLLQCLVCISPKIPLPSSSGGCMYSPMLINTYSVGLAVI